MNKVPEDIIYPDAMNADTRASIVGWKVQEILDYLREQHIEVDTPPKPVERVTTGTLKPGVKEVHTPRGPRYFLNSKMIKTSAAFEV